MDDRVFVNYAAMAQSLAAVSKSDAVPPKQSAPKVEASARQQSAGKAEPAAAGLTQPVPEIVPGRHAAIASRLRDWQGYRMWVAEVNKSWDSDK